MRQRHCRPKRDQQVHMILIEPDFLDFYFVGLGGLHHHRFTEAFYACESKYLMTVFDLESHMKGLLSVARAKAIHLHNEFIPAGCTKRVSFAYPASCIFTCNSE